MIGGGASQKLQFILSVDSKGAVKGFEQVGKAADKDLKKAEERLDKLGTSMTKVGAGMMAFAGVAGAALMGLAKASERQTMAELKLQNTISNMPKLAGESIDRFKDLATALQKVTVVGDEASLEMMAMLGTFQLTGDEIERISPLVLDYARKFDIDVVSAATQVGKALDGQMGALKRNGVSIDEAMFKTDRYAAVQQALSNQVGGFAEEEAKTFTGQIQQMKNQLGDLAEGIGAGVIPVFSSMIGVVGKGVDMFSSLSPEVQKGVGSFAAIGTAAIGAAGALSFVAGQVIKHRQRFQQMFTTMSVDGVRSFNKFGVAATAGMAVAGLAMLAYAGHAASAAKNQEILNNRLGDLSRVNPEQKMDVLTAAMANLVVEGKSVEQALAIIAERSFDGLAAALDYAEANGQLEVSYRGVTFSTDQMRAALDGEIKARKNAETAAKQGERALDANTDAAEDNADATNTAAKAQETYAKRLDESRKKLRDQSDAHRAAFDSTYAMEQATWKAQEALWAYTSTNGNAEASERDKTVALREAEQAYLDLAYKAAESASVQKEAQSGVALTAEQKNAIVVRELQKTAKALAPGDPLRANLEAYATRLDAITTEVTTEFKANTTEAERAIERIRQAYENVMRSVTVGSGGSAGPTGPRRIATGTVSARPGLALVGEQGPELVAMAGGERVYNNRESRQMSGGSQPVVNSMTVNISAQMLEPTPAAAKALVNMIRDYERRNGSGWRS